MKKTLEQENNILLNSFLKHTLLKGFENGIENFNRLELYVNTKCNLNCKYCYLANYGEDLYPKEIQDSRIILKNLEIVLNWLIENKYHPDIDFFGGEPFSQEISFKALNLILNKFRKVKNKPQKIVIPTNYTFLISLEKTKRIEELIIYSRKVGIPITLSASIDGKYCDKGNRPFKVNGKNTERDSDYYDKVFRFIKKYDFGFHPMIYSNLIEKWRDNFLWFQKNFKRFKIPFYSLYLLEVRNVEWAEREIKDYAEFISFLIEWTFINPCKRDKNLFLNFIRGSGYNTLRSSFTTIGRGLGCSLQSTLFVRLGDLAIGSCHRTFYPHLITSRFIVKDNKIRGIKSENPELFITAMVFNTKNTPICENCLLKYLCSGGCLGSQFETTGDLFSPIPTVCQLEHAKIYAMIKTYKKLNLYNKIYSILNENKKNSLDLFNEIMS